MKKLFLPTVVAALAWIGSYEACGQTFISGTNGPSTNPSADSGAYDYGDAANWSSDTVPATSSGAHAIINNGDFVDYFGNSDGDLILANGGELEISNGTFKEANGTNWQQLEGNGTILIDGGNYIQGTDSNNPVNVSGSGNLFEITAGTASLSLGLSVRSGMTFQSTGGTTTITGGPLQVASGASYIQSGGVVTDNSTSANAITGSFALSSGSLTLGGEFDYNAAGDTISGGTLTTTLITGANGPTGDALTLSGGEIVITGNSFSGFYGGDNSNHPVNFTIGSSGQVDFLTDTESQVQALINAGGFQYNGATDPTDLQVTADTTGGYIVSVVTSAVPEPQTWGMIISGIGLLVFWNNVSARRRGGWRS